MRDRQYDYLVTSQLIYDLIWEFPQQRMTKLTMAAVLNERKPTRCAANRRQTGEECFSERSPQTRNLPFVPFFGGSDFGLCLR